MILKKKAKLGKMLIIPHYLTSPQSWLYINGCNCFSVIPPTSEYFGLSEDLY